MKAEFGLIGHPLGHSFSAAYFSQKFARENLDFRYTNFDIADLKREIPALKAEAHHIGFNVTIPHKQDIIAFLNRLSPEAAAIGAVNTIKVEQDGSWTGHNTDHLGFFESLQDFLPQGEKPLSMVFGNGGASQAVQYALYAHGFPYFLVSRAPKKSDTKAFAPVESLSYAELSADLVTDCRLLINATSLGMFPNVNACPDIPYEAVGKHHFAYDLVYNPEETTFMKRCAAQGAKTLNGLSMLHLQAQAAWRIWTETPPSAACDPSIPPLGC